MKNEDMNAKFTIFAANFKAMKLSKDQKNLLKGGLAGWAGMVVAAVLFAVFGGAFRCFRQTHLERYFVVCPRLNYSRNHCIDVFDAWVEGSKRERRKK